MYVYYRNYAIADYLQASGFNGALEAFKREAEVVSLLTGMVVVVLFIASTLPCHVAERG